ncbi:phosphopantetheine-containing protein [Helicobacter didelphidarum]|uniref:Phosphopantetheine-containing protein n=2 Tax=Helicobacter didelphidarum TaxID=2040648 RepID=A0A3D8INC6_9HELI|nr:phosphopantetheine-containing protein [Helicobacter didelphidarum]
MLDLNTLKAEDMLDSFEDWDSMAHLSLIALFDSKLGKKIKPDEIRGLKSVQDILDLAGIK